MEHINAAQNRLNKIREHLLAGHSVIVATNTRATKFQKKHIDFFRVSGNSLEARYGKSWLCIDYCNFSVVV